MIKPDPATLLEIEEQRPRTPPGLLSIEERDRLIERSLIGLYRWYLSVSQQKRNWNPDTSFDWRALRTDHSPEIKRVIEGFFAVEQYIPDYAASILRLVRRSHGRSHFQLRWGAEEEKHADLWHNALLFLRDRSPAWIRDYMESLRKEEWRLPFADPVTMTCYVVIQERATQINYLNMALVAQGKAKVSEFNSDADPVLDRAARTIAVDEAAHYNFFLSILNLYLYYYPAQAIEALQHVVANFAMPANQYIPDFQSFGEALVKTAIYGPRDYTRDVLQVVFDQIGVKGRRALEDGIRRSREVPAPDNEMRSTSFLQTFDYDVVENAVKRIYSRINEYEKQIGIHDLDPAVFVPSGYSALKA